MRWKKLKITGVVAVGSLLWFKHMLPVSWASSSIINFPVPSGAVMSSRLSLYPAGAMRLLRGRRFSSPSLGGSPKPCNDDSQVCVSYFVVQTWETFQPDMVPPLALILLSSTTKGNTAVQWPHLSPPWWWHILLLPVLGLAADRHTSSISAAYSSGAINMAPGNRARAQCWSSALGTFWLNQKCSHCQLTLHKIVHNP